jgi:hypothetical protein
MAASVGIIDSNLATTLNLLRVDAEADPTDFLKVMEGCVRTLNDFDLSNSATVSVNAFVKTLDTMAAEMDKKLAEAGLGVAFRAKPAVAAAAHARIDHADLTALLYAQGYRIDEFAPG